MDFKVFLSYIITIVFGGWTVSLGINNFKKGYYFWFGVQMFVCVYIAALLVRLQLI